MPLYRRVLVGLRYMIVAGVTVVAVGLTCHLPRWPPLTISIRPAPYKFTTHPHGETSQARMPYSNQERAAATLVPS